jgi:glycosyltransferase involved in cell wall biosynthesis
MALRILHCISSVNPTAGGPIEGLKQLSGVNRSHGHQVEVVSLDSPDDPWVAECPVTCHAMGPGTVWNYRYSPRLTPWLRAHAKEYDAVIVNGIWQFHAYASWKALHDQDVPYFVFTHGMLDPWFKRTYPLKHLKKWLFWPWSEYRLLRDAKAVLFTCEEERRLARESFWLYSCNEKVISYGTTQPPAASDQQRVAFSERFPSLLQTRNLLFLGRVHEKKGTDLLFQALARVRARRPEALQNVRLLMAGPADHAYGNEMQALCKQLQLDDLTVWAGMVQGDLKWGAFRHADAFILPSHQENFGIAVAEALACGLPVLISNQVNIWREIEQAGAGLVQADTLDGTEALIDAWLDTPPAQWQTMRAKATQCFSQKFDIERTALDLIHAMSPTTGQACSASDDQDDQVHQAAQ